MDDRRVSTGAHVAFTCFVTTAFLVWVFHTTGSSARARLTVIGGLLEVVGIALLAIDFWWPPIRRSWPAARRWLEGGAAHVRAEAHVAATWLRRALRRKATVTGSAKLGLTFETNAAGVVTPAAARGKSNAQLVRELGDLTARVDRLEVGVREEIQALTGAVQEMIRRSKDEYLGLRIVGLVVALTGSVLLAAANLV